MGEGMRRVRLTYPLSDVEDSQAQGVVKELHGAHAGYDQFPKDAFDEKYRDPVTKQQIGYVELTLPKGPRIDGLIRLVDELSFIGIELLSKTLYDPSSKRPTPKKDFQKFQEGMLRIVGSE
jgi:hypothetical protein